MSSADLAVSYQLIAELLLNPIDRDMSRIESLRAEVAGSMPEVAERISTFLAEPGSDSSDEYIQTLELSPPCPLYLGAYLFDEPSTCNGVGTSGRNAYMLELLGLYGHFGLNLSGHELPDFLPAMVDFLWISLEAGDDESLSLRRRFVEHSVLPGLEPLREALGKYKSPYALLITALEAAVTEDIDRMGDTPAWTPPEEREASNVSLPVVEGDASGGMPRLIPVGESEDRP